MFFRFPNQCTYLLIKLCLHIYIVLVLFEFPIIRPIQHWFLLAKLWWNWKHGVGFSKRVDILTFVLNNFLVSFTELKHYFAWKICFQSQSLYSSKEMYLRESLEIIFTVLEILHSSQFMMRHKYKNNSNKDCYNNRIELSKCINLRHNKKSKNTSEA